MPTTASPIPFVLTFESDFIGHVGMRVDGRPMNVQVVRSIESFEVDPDNDLDYAVTVDWSGHRHHVYLDWLVAVRPAVADVVGRLV